MKLYSTNEAAEKLGVSLRRVQAMITEGKLPAEKMGRDYFIKDEDLQQVKVYGKAGRPPKAKKEK